MKNALTIDVEDWYQTLDFDLDIKCWPKYEDRIANNTNRILDLLSKFDVKATFFVLGCVAESHPELVREINQCGHEIGSHGGWHRLVKRQTREEFRKDVIYSKVVLENIIGKPVSLYRASSWSISSDTLWALEILEEEGFKCDSSIQPFKTPLSGMSGVPDTPFHPVIGDKQLKILEFPSTVLQLGNLHIPFSGGFYLRVLPYSIISWVLRNLNRQRPGMIYVHPWETDVDQPKIQVPGHIRFTHYYKLNTTIHKLGKLLSDFDFVPLGELIKAENYPSYFITPN